jgi:hypothetical protein
MGLNVRHVLAVSATAVLGAGLAACNTTSAPAPAPAAPAPADAAHTVHLPPPADNAPAAPLRDGERFLRLSMTRAYVPVPPNGGNDLYRCFLIDPKLTARSFVTGSQFLASNQRLLHHAIIFRVQPNQVTEARAKDEADKGDGWTCFGGTGLRSGGPGQQLRNGLGWIAAWAPGGKETVLRNNTGYELAPGSQIIMQVHYNLLATEGKAEPDRSGIRLRLTHGGRSMRALQTALVPAPVELPCPSGQKGLLCDREQSVLDVWKRFGPNAGALVAGLNLLCNGGKDPKPGPTQRCDMPVREAGTVYAVAGHMHLLGRSIKVELNPGTSRAKTLLDVRNYDFDQQGARPLARPVAVKAGDRFRVTCTHDVSLRSQLPQLRELPPRYVVWGDGSSDEMCLGIVVWTRG